MRLTVGPLSPSVYWRRRAVVVGAVFAVILILAYSCSGGDDPGKKTGGAQPTVTPSETGIGAGAASPVPSVITPNPSEPSSGIPANTGSNTGANAGGATGETCTDGELTVVSAAESTTVRQGYPVKFFIRIKNVSTRTCVRDVGAQMQELYLEQGNEKHWSSDACGRQGGTADVRQLQPNLELEYYQVWEGKSTAQGCAAQPLLQVGTYQLRGRLGNKISEPVTVTITA
jgi:hypothetical protein